MSQPQGTVSPENLSSPIAAQTEIEAKDRFLDLLQSIDAIVWEMDLSTWQFTFVSDRAQQLLGYPVQQWLSEPTFWQDTLLHPDDRAQSIQFCLCATREGRDHEFEYRAVAADGKIVWLKDIVRVIKNSQNQPQTLRGIMLDITREKLNEQAVTERNLELQREREARQELEAIKEVLRESEYRYAQILNSVQDMVYSLTPDSQLIYANQSTQDYYDKSLEELRLEQTLNSEVDARVIATRQPIEVAEEPKIRADGEVRFFNTIRSPIFDITGQVVEIVGVSRDITERKQERELRDRALAETQAARTELQTVFALAPASIWTTHGPDHIIQTANAVFQQFNGVGEDCFGRSARDLLPALAQQGFFDLLDQVYASGKPYVGREERADFDLDGDGQIEESYWNYIYHPLFDGSGQVYGTMVHAVDVTEQVRSRQEIEQKAEALLQLTRALEASNRELDQFAYIASHDLKAPLRAIANLSTWLEEDLEDVLTDDARQQMKLLRGRVHRMEGLIEGILQYSRAGRFRGKLERVSVQRLLQETIELLAPPPHVQIAIAPGMPTLITEKIPLEQVFLNLIGNALKYGQSAAQPKIEIRVCDRGQFYEFAVADNGAGIAPEYQHKIWGIFQRLEARDQVEGTGIGLSVVQKIVEMRGGKIWVESEVGQGATFYFTWNKSAAIEA